MHLFTKKIFLFIDNIIVYVYEGVDIEGAGRPRLINPMYFGGIYEGTKGVRQLWDEVYSYIGNAYDVNVLEKIYINGDGDSWIKSGTKYIRQAEFRLDKYITTATAHLGDSAEETRSDIYRAIYKKKKWMADMPVYSIPYPQIKKIVALRNHIWGCKKKR